MRKQDSVAGPALLTALILGRHLAFVPIWDSRNYFESLRAAVRLPFNLLNFDVFGHPTMLFMLWSSLGQYLDLGNAVLLNLSQLVLAILGIWGFRGILRSLIPSAADASERLLATLAFAALPIVLASEQSFNPDTGVMVFSLLYLAFLLEGRYRSGLVAGLFLVSSKESGVILYLFATGIFVVQWWLDPSTPRPRAVQMLKRTFAFLPFLSWGAVFLFAWSKGRAVIWRSPIAAENQNVIGRALIPDPHDLSRLSYGAGIWIVNFHWVWTIVILAAILVFFRVRSWTRAAARAGVESMPAAVVVAFSFCSAVALTRFSTFANLRYLLPVYPMVLAVFVISVRIVFLSRGARLAVLAGFLALSLISVFRTVDPLSRAVYGTFDFGSHSMLKMTSLTGECCGYGRDQLVYNLEFTHLATIQDRIYASIRPTMKTAIVKDGLEEWFIDGLLDATTFRRTLRMENVVRPRYMTSADVLISRNPPSELYYVAFPNVDNAAGFQRLRRRYQVVSDADFAESGYSIRVTKMIQKTARE